MNRPFLCLLLLFTGLPVYSQIGSPDSLPSWNPWNSGKRTYSQWLELTFENPEAAPLQSPRATRALLLSALVPGLGQLYNKSYWKSGLFFAVEVASWFVYFGQRAEGRRLEDLYEQYADAHWDPARYWSALAAESGCDPADMTCLKNYERSNFSHHLPDEKNQTYYENIGKYDQFNIGWDDATEHRARDSEHRERYTLMRKDSNDAFEMARLGASVVLLNHIVSALEAALTARKQDRALQGSIRFRPMKVRNEVVPALAVRLAW